MSIGSVGSSSSASYTAMQPSVTNAMRESGPEKEQDGDKDDGMSATKPAAPTVNMQGQTIGSLINVTA